MPLPFISLGQKWQRTLVDKRTFWLSMRQDTMHKGPSFFFFWGNGEGVLDFRCSYCILTQVFIVFSSSSHWVPNMFQSSQCVPPHVLNSSSALSSTLFIYVVQRKRLHGMSFGTVQSFILFLFYFIFYLGVMGQTKMPFTFLFF
jgi:hypothetical protein